MKIKYEFLIATNKYSNYITEAINSILNQETSIDYSLRIVANGCDDDYYEFLKQFRSKKVKIYLHKLSLGQLAFALNYGASKSRADYLLRMDDDDIALKDRLELTKTRIFENKYPDVIAFGADLVDFEGKLLKKNMLKKKSPKELKKILPFKNPIIHPTVAIKRNSLLKIGGYLGSKTNEDYDLWIRMFREDFKIIREVDTVLKYRIHSNQSAKKLITYTYSAGYSLGEALQSGSIRWFISIFFKILKYLYRRIFSEKS